MTWEVSDRTEDHHPGVPAPAAVTWWTPLTGGLPGRISRKRCRPAPSKRVATRLHEAKCACGRVLIAARPVSAPDSPLSAGPPGFLTPMLPWLPLIGMCGKPAWLRRLHLDPLGRLDLAPPG